MWSCLRKKVNLLFIGPDELQAIKKLKQWAEAHVISFDDLKAIDANSKPPVGDDPRHVIFLPVNVRVVFSIEQQPKGLVRHLSISIKQRSMTGRFPDPNFANEILKAFGYVNDLNTPSSENFYVYIEEEVHAINFVEYYDNTRSKASASSKRNCRHL